MGLFLLEDGGHLLTEDGGHLLTEEVVVSASVAGSWGSLAGVVNATRSTEVIVSGSWSVLAGVVNATRSTEAIVAGAWGSLSCNAIAGRSIEAIVSGSWSSLAGNATATRSTEVIVSGAWGALLGSTVGEDTIVAGAQAAWSALVGTVVATVTGVRVGTTAIVNYGPEAEVVWLGIEIEKFYRESLMNKPPSDIGDLIELTVRFKPPDGSTAICTAASMIIRSPSGGLTVVAGTEVSTNFWHFQAPARIDASGRWFVRINANAGLIASLEFPIDIAKSHYETPVP